MRLSRSEHRRRRGVSSAWRPPWLVAGVGGLMAVTSCATGPSAGQTPRATSSSSSSVQKTATSPSARSTAAPLTYANSRYYLSLPTGWTASVPTRQTWTRGSQPDVYTTGFTTFTAPHSPPQLAVGSRPVSPRLTLAGWRKQLAAGHELDYAQCSPKRTWGGAVLAGSPALRLFLSCPSVHRSALVLLSRRVGRGWAVVCAVRVAEEARVQRTCDGLLHDMRFAQ